MKQDHDSSVFGAGAKDTGQRSVEGFTPGPWEAWQEAGPNGPWHVHTAEGHIYIGHLPDGAPDEPNARLIAAAPDLYEACKAALGAFERNDAIDWNILSRALAKAVPQTGFGDEPQAQNTDKSKNNTGGTTSDGGEG